MHDRSSQGATLSQHATHNRIVVRASTGNVPASISDLLTFSDCPSMLRASRLSRVMRGGAALFKNSTGSAHTYELSQVVTIIDAFISHNWVTARWKKYLVLALHFNTGVALLVQTAVMVVLATATYLGILPSYVSDAGYSIRYVARLTSVPVFLTVFLFFRDVWPYGRDPLVFLDKTCIHQTDEEKKKIGISKLSAFIAQSRTLVVCYNNLYLSKLWTVYELASFLTTSPAKNIKLFPMHLPAFIVITLVTWYATDVASLVAQINGVEIEIQFFTIPFFFLAGGCVLRRASRDRAEIRRSFANFSVRDAKCFNEDDRQVVNHNIGRMMRTALRLPDETSENEALHHFDHIVKRELPFVVEDCCGRYGVPYGDWVMIALVAFLPTFYDSFACLAHGTPVKLFMIDFVMWCFFMTFVCAPLFFGVFMHRLASVRLDWVGIREALWMSVFFVVVAAVFFVTNQVLIQAKDLSRESEIALTLYVLVEYDSSVWNVLLDAMAFLEVDCDGRRVRAPTTLLLRGRGPRSKHDRRRHDADRRGLR